MELKIGRWLTLGAAIFLTRSDAAILEVARLDAGLRVRCASWLIIFIVTSRIIIGRLPLKFRHSRDGVIPQKANHRPPH
jgi:hypothetical protein